MNLQRYKQKQMSTDKKIYLLHSSHKPIVHNINNYTSVPLKRDDY